MNQYLLSICYPAGATQPPPDVLQRIMKDVAAVNQEMKAAGAWVFAGGLHPPDTATVVRVKDGEIAHHRRSLHRSRRSRSAASASSRRPTSTPRSKWGEKLSRAVTVPVEVRPMNSHG